MHHRLLPTAALVAVLLAALLAPAPRSAAQPAAEDRPPDQTLLQPPQGPGIAAAGDYLSPPTAAAHPFTHILLRWEAHRPGGAGVTLFVRASRDGSSWGEWAEVAENDDLWRPSDGPDVAWSQTLDAGGLARFWQVRAAFAPGDGGTLPELRQVEVNTVDASGPAPAPPPQTFAAVGKPAVVSRVGWGSPDGEGSRAAPAYYPVNHMVVHHTADSNTLLPGEPDWAARVRAEWRFHTYTRSWGDVGYNYLIDPDGVIYEGRAGGDDAVAFHDTGNYGSMGVVLIGTYATVPPTQAAQDALARLLAWKASQKGIDPLGRSYYYGCDISKYCRPYNAGAVVPNIAGHRDVTPGHTTCPGDQTIAYLPGIRERVKRMVSDGSAGGGGDNGDLVVDDMESSFARSNANWHEAFCGYSGHTYWTYASDGAPENSATWRPNLPKSGRYRVYVHVPQGCGLGSPPYASTRATYGIHTAEGDFHRTVDHNTATTWVDVGAYQFDAGTGGAVELYDNTGEPLSAGRVLFFDAVKWVPENATTGAQITAVQYDRSRLASGELLKVTFTVKNTGSTTLRGQAPRVDLSAGGGLNALDNGYVYDQDECFAGNTAGSYPAFPKEDDRFRVVLGTPGWDGRGNGCVGETSDYPWRWGLNDDLPPGAQQTIVGYVRFREPGSYTLQAGLVQEYVQYYQEGASPTTITVTPERAAPAAASYDDQLRPMARVYRLGGIPDNFLARTQNPLSIPRGEYVGSFAWDGSFTNWGDGGPLGLSDQFLIEQTRSFVAPATGEYAFRTSTDDGSWLWVDGTPVVVNNGLHPADDATGTIVLGAGLHVVSFKYFERTGYAAAGYAVQAPGDSLFRTLSDGLSSALRLGGTFAENPALALAADDQGGSGVARIRWSWDGANWQDSPGALLEIGRLANSSYRLRYQAFDANGNADLPQPQELAFTVNTNLALRRAYLPVAAR
jgi:hypothetical protein